MKQDIDRVAASDLPVFILGETGTGKELAARILQMVQVNCASLPASIAESELGATQDRMGKFELADGGTLFLDEVGELPAARALQFCEIQRVGRTAAFEPIFTIDSAFTHCICRRSWITGMIFRACTAAISIVLRKG